MCWRANKLILCRWYRGTILGFRDSADSLGHRKSTLKALGTYVKEHYANAAYGVYPIEGDSKVAIIIVANKYSPNNFW